MPFKLPLPLWTILAPVLAWLAYGGLMLGLAGAYSLVLAGTLIGGVLAAVYHAEVVAHRVGEPFGTLVLAMAVTIIEVSLIVSLMLAGGPETAALARDTVFAAVMIILTGIIGVCLLAGGARFKEQVFGIQGVSTALVTLTAILVLTLILPNYTTSIAGPIFNYLQQGFIALVSLVLYGTFVLVQTVRHRDFFLPPETPGDEDVHAPPPSNQVSGISFLLLLVCLGAVVLLAKALAPDIETGVVRMGAPKSLVGVIIAAVVLLPEGLAAWRAAKNNRLQTSLNLALGSALASIGLTIPAVAVLSSFTGLRIILGIDIKSSVLLVLSLITVMLSLSTGRTNIQHGVVLLVIFAVYLFTTIVP
ncbi:MAG: calcium:proton antiporter [Adhaeribacter sp.]